MMFGDTFTANSILKATTLYEVKKLSYQINGAKRDEWCECGYEVCFTGIAEKSNQNPNLMSMLRATKGLIIAEALNDKQWRTGIPLKD